ncbi:MAG: hypothetical protein GQ553_05185 [Nitrosomonadaceae bacterium]|nr:hypothetical protein [Nitrosomonadaceae bacterium]
MNQTITLGAGHLVLKNDAQNDNQVDLNALYCYQPFIENLTFQMKDKN